MKFTNNHRVLNIYHSAKVTREGSTIRRWRGQPIGFRPVWIELATHIVVCISCKIVRQVSVTFTDARRTYTKKFERYALDLSSSMTIQDVARHLHLSWDVRNQAKIT